MVGIGFEQGLYNHGFGSLVDFTDKILGALGRDGKPVQVAGAALDDGAGLACRLDGGVEHRMHKFPDWWARQLSRVLRRVFLLRPLAANLSVDGYFTLFAAPHPS